MEGVWKREGLGNGLINLAFKLKRVKAELKRVEVSLKEWNGKTNVIIKDLETRIENLEIHLQHLFNVEEENDLLVSKLELLT